MSYFLQIIMSLIIICALGGCGVYTARDFSRMPVSTAERFSLMPSNEAVSLSWQDAFNHPDIHRLITEALANNLDIGMAWDRLNASRAALGIAQSDWYPSLDVNTDAQRLRNKETDAKNTRNNLVIGTALSWEIDIWQRIASQTKAAKLDLQAQQALAHNTQLLIIAEVINHYQQIYHMEQLIKLVDQQVQTNQAFHQLTKLRLANGQASALDVLQQQNQLLDTQGLQPEFKRQLRRLQHSLALLVGNTPTERKVSNATILNIKLPSSLPSPKALIDLRPDLQASYARLQATDYQVAAAIADRMPRLSLSLTGLWAGTAIGNIGDTSNLSAGTGLLIPLFDGFNRANKVKQRKAEVEETLKQFSKNTLQALKEVEDALADTASYEAQLTLKAQQLDVSTRNTELARQRYLQGANDYLSVLDTLRSQQQEERKLITLKRHRTEAIITLYKALGATWHTPPLPEQAIPIIPKEQI